MVEVLISLYVLWKEEGLLQSLNHMTGVPPAVMLKEALYAIDTLSTSSFGDQVRVSRRT